MPPAPNRTARRAASVAPGDVFAMTDLLWLGVLGGLFAATLAYVRLCDGA